ncbi:nucleoside kinase [Treponema pedis]|uniref:Phosphoribulokinase/uridine kinase n=2 Tax=Treponema pedis TaxID=409322 RepID=S6A920_9SPIR|nr:nucleoside kinase [Treponema pedis]AGT44814.1 phosphoribulokinase/uridine kinase [Treponema pedis str. T A4]QOW60111.1 nucleoside kinase [Treponema pedis]
MSSFKITFPDGSQKQFVQPVSARELIPYLGKLDAPIVGVKLNNLVVPLNKIVDVQSRIEPVTLANREGSNIYRRTLCLILAAAAKEIYPELRLLMGHSLDYGYYYTFEGTKSKKIDLNSIKKKMDEFVQADMPIETVWLSYEEAVEKFEKSNQPETYRLLNYTSKPKILVNRLGSYEDLYFQPLMDRIGEVKVFDLMPYGDGFLLRFPKTSSYCELSQFNDIPQLFEIYKEYKAWGKLVGVSSVGQLNDLITSRKIKEYVEITEILQNNKLAEIAKKITAKKSAKVILIAGPSSSGKTTSAKKLSMQLQVLGLSPKVISLDDFYLGAAKAPKNPDGTPDFECVEALDIELLNDCLLGLFKGETVEMPSYDFKLSARRAETKPLKAEENTIFILEGIHALNDKLTAKVDSSLKFKIYLSALTQLNLDDHNRIPTSDNRLLRRIVRDAQFRGSPASRTIGMWGDVRSGEAKYIFPFQGNADAVFNTALDYELAVLKVYAEPLLKAVKPFQAEYNEASRLLTFLGNFLPLPAHFVHGQSILREFIGNSDFSYR